MSNRQRRKADLSQRLRSTNPNGRDICWVIGCKRPPGNTSGDGLGRLCRPHLEHHRRHGDPLKASYTAVQIAPHREAARAWLKTNATDAFVVATIGGVEGKMLSAGIAIEPRNLRGVSAAEKARSVWARLRDKGRPPREILAVILGVAMCYAADIQRAKAEHRRVQIGKALSRMGGGQVKRWPTHDVSRETSTVVLKWFPASEGLVLRELGEEAERIAEFLIHDEMEKLLAFGSLQRQERAMRNLPFVGE